MGFVIPTPNAPSETSSGAQEKADAAEAAAIATAAADATAKANAAQAAAIAAASADATAKVATKSPLLVLPSVKTANFNCTANEYYRIDTSGGPVVATLPAAPAEGTAVIVKWVAGSSAASVVTSGSDKFNTTAGGTTASFTVLNQHYTLTYDANDAVWIVETSLSLAQLDTRYLIPMAPPVKANQWVQAAGPMAELGAFAAIKDTTSLATFSPTSHTSFAHAGGTGATNITGNLYWRRTLLPACTIDKMAIRQYTNGPASAVHILGFWSDNHATYPGFMGTLLASGSVAADTGGSAYRVASVAYAHPGGWVWVGYCHQGSGVGVSVGQEQGGWQAPVFSSDGVTPTAHGVVCAIKTGVTGALPDTTSQTWVANVGACPSILLRIASVP